MDNETAASPEPMAVETPQQIMAWMIANAHVLIKDEGHIQRMLFVMCGDGSIAIIPFGWSSDEERDGMIAAARGIMIDMNAKFYGVISEVWKVVYNGGPIIEPSQAENRTEEVVAITVSREGEKLRRSLEIIRDADGKASLGPEKIMGNAAFMSDPLTTFFDEGPTLRNAAVKVDADDTPETIQQKMRDHKASRMN